MLSSSMNYFREYMPQHPHPQQNDISFTALRICITGHVIACDVCKVLAQEFE